MDPAEYAALARRLIDNPQDAEALAAARRLGLRDAGTYALLLEKVGHGSTDRRTASHWFTEAAAVWSTTLGDTRRTESVLRESLRADPWNERAAEWLARMLEVTADPDGLLATLEGRAAACANRTDEVEDGVRRAADIFLYLGHRLNSGPFARADRALGAYERAIALDPANREAIRAARGLYAVAGRWPEVAASFEKERALLHKRADKLQSYREEATLLRSLGDSNGAIRALRYALSMHPNDLVLAEELANAILGRLKAGEAVTRTERLEAAQLFVSLAETYDGEMALAHVLNALRANPGNDVAIDLAFKLAIALGHQAMLSPFAVAYLGENPKGKHAVRVRLDLAGMHETAGRIDDAIKVLAPIERDNMDAAAKITSLMQRTGRVDDVVARMDAHAASLPPMARQGILLEAARLLDKNDRTEAAIAHYEQLLAIHPAHPEALDKVASHLRARKERGPLRDLLILAAGHASTQPGTRRSMLREAAELSLELDDHAKARDILAQLYEENRSDAAVRALYKQVLAKLERWDDVIKILDRQIGAARSAEDVVAVLREHASVHENGRSDRVQAAHSWARIAKLAPEDDEALERAVALYETADCLDEAISLLSAATVRLPEASRPPALARMAALAEKRGMHQDAAEAVAARAALTNDPRDWHEAERLFTVAGGWLQAADALDHQQEADQPPAQQAATHARKAEYLAKAGETARAIEELERACELDPTADAYWVELEWHCESSENQRRFVAFALGRAERLDDKDCRVSVRRRAARTLRDVLHDAQGALAVQRKVLEDLDDTEALTDLAEDAERRGAHQEACDLLLRLEAALSRPSDQLRLLLRVARIRFDQLGDAQGALALLERALLEVDGASAEALEESVRIRSSQQDWPGVAMVLERAEARSSVPEEKLALELRLADVCEHELSDPARAIEHLRAARGIDVGNRDTQQRLARLHESCGQWKELSEVLASLMAGETDREQLVAQALRRASVLDEKLNLSDDALAVLSDLADAGDAQCRAAYVEVADRAGAQRRSAEKLEEWAASAGDDAGQTGFLRGAFDRYLAYGLLKQASQIAARLAATGLFDADAASRLERAALEARDIEVAQAAQGYLMSGREGADRVQEALRQAEALVAAGADRSQVVLAAEAELSALPPVEMAQLIPRLAELCASAEDRLALYERHVARSGGRSERMAAIAAAASVAARSDLMQRCQRLFAMAVSSATQDEDFLPMEQQTVDADRELGGQAVRKAWAHALAEGASNTRMAADRRAELLRRAGRIAYRELGDPAQAFDWFNEATFVRLEATFDTALAQQGDQLRDLTEVLRLVGKRLDDIEQRIDGADSSIALRFGTQDRMREGTLAARKADEPVVQVTYPGERVVEAAASRPPADRAVELASEEVLDDLGGDSVADEVPVTFETGEAAAGMKRGA